MEFVNLTPHALKLNDGRIFPPSGIIARVSVSYAAFNEDSITKQVYGDIKDLPEPKNETIYIVSGLVLSALNGSREDVVAPATGHPEVMRNEAGQINSVPGFTR